MCYPGWKKIACLISRNTLRYYCPINYIPTKDNVLVSVDVGIQFHIGNRGRPGDDPDDTRTEKQHRDDEELDAIKFFYNFGPNRLEELLQEETEEGIRDFVKNIKVYRLRDAKTELTEIIKDEMKVKFLPYGVHIERVDIMYTAMPTDLRTILMDTSKYDVQLQKQVK